MPYHHLTRQERSVIHRMRINGFAVPEMAKALGRHRSTIYREFGRNAAGPNSYVGATAHTMYRKRLRRARSHKRFRQDYGSVMAHVRTRLKRRWSPEQVANKIVLEFPKNPRMRLCTMTIYRYIRADKAKGGQLHTHLRHSRKKKHKRYGGSDQRGHIRGRVLIDERPAIVDKQTRFGDWEADTMWGSTRKAYLATFVDRKSLYLIVRKMPDRTADSLNRAALSGFRHIPESLRCSLTVDNGKEFADFAELQRRLGMDVYFAHPYAAWERPINENINGLIRQYVPKKTDIASYSFQYIAAMVTALNNRPRKKLGYKTPYEVFSNAKVALDM